MGNIENACQSDGRHKIACMKLKKCLNILKNALPFVLCVAIILCATLIPRGKEVQADTPKRVITVWNVDTFEGGKGSRTSFLKKIARRTEKKRGGVYYLISSYTKEGAEAALSQGVTPDILSFGVGLSDFAEKSLPIPLSFAGGETDGGCLAYPWCRGKYYLFSLTDNFEEAGETAIGCGGSNLSVVSAAFEGIQGTEMEALAAYTGFLGEKYRYLLGTQRDECRFLSRGVQVYKRELSEYCDLYQYFSVLSSELRDDCFALLDELLSQEAQEELSEIGMYPLSGDEAKRTVSAFSSADALQILHDRATHGDEIKNLDNFLKSI